MNGPDVRALADEALHETAFPGARVQAFRIFLEPSAHRAMREHCRAHSGVEVCGVLVGAWARDATGPYVRVDAHIRGEAATSRFAEVTFTHDTWAEINRRMDSEYAQLRIVGWYHSHPDFGIFLSDRDRFIHEHFFSAPGQIALVIDPVRDEEGIFVWQDGRPESAPLYWVGDAPRVSSRAPSGPAQEHAAADDGDGPAPTPLHHAAAQRERRPLSTILAATGLLFVGLWVGDWLGGFGEHLRTVRIAEGMARQLAARSTSFESSAAVSRAAARVSTLLDRLAAPAPAIASPPAAGGGTPPPAPESARDSQLIKLDDPTARETIRRDLQQLQRELLSAMRSLDMSQEEQRAIDVLLARRLMELEAASKAAAKTQEQVKPDASKSLPATTGGAP
jgi:proteasome lid subunit RPN8/RPN11